MRKLRIGVWLNDEYNPTVGGGYGYYSAMINALSHYQFNHADIIFLSLKNNLIKKLGSKPVYYVNISADNLSGIHRVIRFLSLKFSALSRLKKYYQNRTKINKEKINDWLYKYCDVTYQIIPGCPYSDYPFIYTLWDLGHKTTYVFPEFNENGIFEKRKQHHDNVPHKALMILCESHTGKSDAIKYLNLNEKRIKILPMFPSEVTKEELIPIQPKEINSQTKFIHYPAQYWAHKNHINLLRAFKEVLKEYDDLKLVLSGSDKGNYQYIIDYIAIENLDDHIIDLGFVSLENLKWLYQHSKGLIMPTLLGPTNMPPLEALALGCPAAVSFLPGHYESLGDNAIYFDPLNYLDIAEAIKILIKKERKDTEIIKIPTAYDNMKLLDNYFNELNTIRSLWKK
jgi:glycosyltransferase involved in cell wall biosynthesis